MNGFRNFNEYMRVKEEVLYNEATVNWVKEQLHCSMILARCLVKDWKREEDE